MFVLSNIGSFGPDVYMIGSTRQLDPMEHIAELSKTAVPFPFDVHMLIASDNAAELEAVMHQAIHKHRVNKINLGKTFFRADIEKIWQIAVANHGSVEYVAQPEAHQFRESSAMTDEDFQRIVRQYESASSEVERWDAAD